MNKYICFYKGKEIEIEASSSYKAQQLAQSKFKAKKGYDITVMLAQKNGVDVVHVADF